MNGNAKEAANELPIGVPAPEKPVGRPFTRIALQGRSVALLPLDAATHGDALFASFHECDPEGRIWTYMGSGPFATAAEFQKWLKPLQESEDLLFYAIAPADTAAAAGMAAFMRMDVDNGVAEIGHIWFAPTLQKTRPATEAIFLMMRHVLETQGCRRLEWKCNALNAASRRAALRFGFAFEGVFRNHMVVKGRNRDTAWYAIIVEEWPAIRGAFETWLDDANFDENGRQRTSLAALTNAAREASCVGLSGGL